MPVGVPHYAIFHSSNILCEDFSVPYGIAVEQTTHQIFVVTYYSGVKVFSETGMFLYQLGAGRLRKPHGIAIDGDCVYVSCWEHTVCKLSLTEMCLLKKIGSRGSNNGQFCFPRGIATNSIGHVLIVDSDNDRVCVYDTNLNNLRNITHESMSQPYDVKVSCDRMYVLCPYNNFVIHVLTLEGERLHSLISGSEMGLMYPHYFCLDALNNFVISDCQTHSIHVFSPEGDLLHRIGIEGLKRPQGVAVTPNGRLVCVSCNPNNVLQVFY